MLLPVHLEDKIVLGCLSAESVRRLRIKWILLSFLLCIEEGLPEPFLVHPRAELVSHSHTRALVALHRRVAILFNH